MKQKIVVLCVMLFTFTNINAQRAGVKVGLNLGQAVYEVEGLGISTSNLAGLQAGLVGEMSFTENVHVNSGLLYTVKGAELSFLGVDIDFPISFLELPLNVAYKHDLGTARVYAQAGPYVALGLSAKSKSGDDVDDIEFGSDGDELKRFDFGFNFGVGIEIERAQVGVSYGLGVANLSNSSESMIKNGVLSFTFAFLIPKSIE